MGEQVGARSKKTTGWKPDEDKTGIESESCRKQDGSQIRIVKSGANLYQPEELLRYAGFTSD